MKVVARYPDAFTAHLVRTRLEDAGIRAFVLDEHSTTNTPRMFRYMESIKVAVAAEDAQRAAKILGGVPARVRRCPRCDSDDVGLTSHVFFALIAFAFTLGLLKPKRRCNACLHEWRE